jgi:hypothetical protein
MKLLLLDTHEEITQLQRDTGNHAWMAQWLARTALSHAEGHTTAQEWLELYQDFGDIEEHLDEMVAVFKLNRATLFGVYHRMLTIQGVWLECRARDFTRLAELTQEGEQILREEHALFADLVPKIKRMLVAAR